MSGGSSPLRDVVDLEVPDMDLLIQRLGISQTLSWVRERIEELRSQVLTNETRTELGELYIELGRLETRYREIDPRRDARCLHRSGDSDETEPGAGRDIMVESKEGEEEGGVFVTDNPAWGIVPGNFSELD
ncbi:MAG: hypothetical protein RLN62_02965 [Rickettsiales bacterium]